jgi:hypothetical protein
MKFFLSTALLVASAMAAPVETTGTNAKTEGISSIASVPIYQVECTTADLTWACTEPNMGAACPSNGRITFGPGDSTGVCRANCWCTR